MAGSTVESASRRFYEAGDWTTDDRPEVQWLISRLRPLSGEHTETVVVDVGCGVGAVAREWVGRLRGIRAVGLDVSFRALAESSGSGLRVAQAQVDGHVLPIASKSVDAVVLTQVIEHVADTDGLMDEIKRILRPGGTLLLSTPNLGAWFNRLLLLGGLQPVFTEVSFRRVFGRPGTVLAGHLRLFTHRALLEFLAFHGFVEIDARGATYHDVPRSARWIDRVLTRFPSVAAQLLVVARTPGNARQSAEIDAHVL